RILSALFVIPSTHLLILSPLPLFSSLSLPPPRYTLFPYTTLFRSVKIDAGTGTRPKAVRLGPGEWRREWRKTRTTGFGNGHIFSGKKKGALPARMPNTGRERERSLQPSARLPQSAHRHDRRPQPPKWPLPDL